MLVLFCLLLYFVVCGVLGIYRRTSLFIAPTTLLLYLRYYESWIQSSCTGECNIRIDVFISIPVLIAVFWVAFHNLSKLNQEKYELMLDREKAARYGEDEQIDNDGNAEVVLDMRVHYADKYTAKKVMVIILILIMLMLIFIVFSTSSTLNIINMNKDNRMITGIWRIKVPMRKKTITVTEQ